VYGVVYLVTLLTMVTSARAQDAQPTSGLPTQALGGAQTPAPGDAALARARVAWEKGDYDVAEPLYREAVEAGGLAPGDVLDSYVHLGSTRAVIGKRESALAAFKTAALISSDFVVPSEAGKRATLLANRAKRAEARLGSIVLHADVPGELSPGDAAQVDATLDAAHAVIATKIALAARDPLSGKSYADTQDAAPSVHFRVPGNLSLPGATIVVRVDALDSHANRLASVEQRVHVKGVAPAPVALPWQRPTASPPTSHRVAADKAPVDSRKKEEKGGFWSSAWPYVLGGAALAAGGAAVYFATRSTDDVNVGAVRVQLTR
jgi:hypothetical protein